MWCATMDGLIPLILAILHPKIGLFRAITFIKLPFYTQVNNLPIISGRITLSIWYSYSKCSGNDFSSKTWGSSWLGFYFSSIGKHLRGSTSSHLAFCALVSVPRPPWLTRVSSSIFNIPSCAFELSTKGLVITKIILSVGLPAIPSSIFSSTSRTPFYHLAWVQRTWCRIPKVAHHWDPH